MWPDDDGSWSPALWPDSTGTTANNGPQVQGNGVLTQSVETSGQDRWSGWFQNLIGGAVQYAVQKDAAKSGLAQGRAPNGQPVYTAIPQSPSVGGMNPMAILIIGGFVLAGVMLVKK